MRAPAETAERHGGSLRLRFLLAIMLWVALGVAGIWYSATRVFETHVESNFHDELEVHVRELARLTRIGDDGQPELMRPLSDPRYEVPLSGYYWQVTSPGQKTLRSESMRRGALDELVAHSPEIHHRLDNGPTGPAITYGFVERSPKGEDVHFVIATDQRELDRTIEGFTREMTWWLGILAALLVATGYVMIGIGLRPLSRLGAAVARLRAGQAMQLEGRYPAEIAPLVDDLNAYVRQNGEMIDRARVQAGNLAHCLRTPLAVIIDEAEQLAGPGRAPDSAKVLLEQGQMMEQQIEYQLARARSSAGGRVPGTASVIPNLLTPIMSAMARLHPDKDFALDNALSGERTLAIDPVDLSELLSILLDNAGKWARHDVRISLDEVDGRVRFRIADDGPGMTPAQIARAFEVGTRFDPGKPGSGLGLAIAKDICEALGASLSLCGRPDGLDAELLI